MPSVRVPRLRAWAQVLVGVLVLAALALHFGAAPFLAALRSIDIYTVAGAVVAVAFGTVCVAYRWRLVAAGLGVPLGPTRSVGDYYVSLLLNATLPGGVLGDVHRGLRHGFDEHQYARCLRAVAWERVLGQVVQVLLTAAVLLLLPSLLPLNRGSRVLGLTVVAALIAGPLAFVLIRRTVRTLRLADSAGPERLADSEMRSAGAASGSAAQPLGRRRSVRATFRADWVGMTAQRGVRRKVVLASTGALVAQVTVFLLSAHSVEPQLSAGRLAMLVPLLLVVLLIGALPLNVAGWGPREAAAAWVFGVAGLGAASGLSISVTFGALSLLGVLPGLAVLAMRRRSVHHA